MTTRVFIIRHGETEWNAERRIQGQRDTLLSKRGQLQAECVGHALSAEPLAAVWSSDLSRATQTAEAVARPHGLPVIRAAGLREAGFGAWEGLNEQEVAAAYPEEYRLWAQDSLRHRPPGGETIEQIQTRAAAVYERILREHAGETVAIVAHGGPIKALVLYAIGASLEAYTRLRMRNASVSLVEVSEHGPVLALYNHVCFHGEPPLAVIAAHG